MTVITLPTGRSERLRWQTAVNLDFCHERKKRISWWAQEHHLPPGPRGGEESASRVQGGEGARRQVRCRRGPSGTLTGQPGQLSAAPHHGEELLAEVGAWPRALGAGPSGGGALRGRGPHRGWLVRAIETRLLERREAASGAAHFRRRVEVCVA
jgi:hypothetical protein